MYNVKQFFLIPERIKTKNLFRARAGRVPGELVEFRITNSTIRNEYTLFKTIKFANRFTGECKIKMNKNMAVETVSDKEFQDVLNNNEKVVVKFFANWCGSCKLIAPKYKRMSDEESMSGVAFIEVNAEENPQARENAGVSNLPFFATYKNGKLVEGRPTSKKEKVEEMIQAL